MTVFNRNKVDFTKQAMFFGEELNSQRYDNFKYPIFDKLTQSQLGYFWRPEEVSLQKDRNDYNELREEQKFIFTSNLKYQTLLDSVQGRGPALAFVPFFTLPELESCMITWDFFETIHSRSYTYMIKNLYSNPSEIFDTIIDRDEFNFYLNYIVNCDIWCSEDHDLNSNYTFVLDHPMSTEEIRYELIGELKPNHTCTIHYSIETNNKTWIITDLNY
jgi:ribonucleotide reductase beta subunit family protein with ferritin-like domain